MERLTRGQSLHPPGSRCSREELRKSILALLLRQQKGCATWQICQETGGYLSAVRAELRVLISQEKIASVRFGKGRIYGLPAHLPKGADTGDITRRAILALFAQGALQGWVSVAQAYRHLREHTLDRVQRVLLHLSREGVLERGNDGVTALYRMPPVINFFTGDTNGSTDCD